MKGEAESRTDSNRNNRFSNFLFLIFKQKQIFELFCFLFETRGEPSWAKPWLKLSYKFGSTIFQPKTAKFGKNLVLGRTIFFWL